MLKLLKTVKNIFKGEGCRHLKHLVNMYENNIVALPMTLGLVGKIGGLEAVPGLGVDTCLCLLGLLLLFATVVVVFLLVSGSPKLFRFGLPGQLMSMNGSLIGTFEL